MMLYNKLTTRLAQFDLCCRGTRPPSGISSIRCATFATSTDVVTLLLDSQPRLRAFVEKLINFVLKQNYDQSIVDEAAL